MKIKKRSPVFTRDCDSLQIVKNNKIPEKMGRWCLCILFSDFSDFKRCLYDKTHQNSDFFEETFLKIARFARLGSEIRPFIMFFVMFWQCCRKLTSS